VTSVSHHNGLITATFGNNSHAVLNGKTLLLSVVTATRNSISWVCKSGNLHRRYLPSACRN